MKVGVEFIDLTLEEETQEIIKEDAQRVERRLDDAFLDF